MRKLITCLSFTLAMLSMPAVAQFEFVEDLTPAGGEVEDFGLGSRVFENDLFVAWPHGFGEPDPAPTCGEVYHYTKNAEGRFELASVLQAPSCSPGDMFGAADMELDGDTLFISALSGLRGDGQGNPSDSRVWIFERDPSYNPDGVNAGWRPVTDLIGSNVGGNRAIGGSLDIEGDTLAVQSVTFETVFGFNFARADGIYIFQRNGDSWAEIDRITESTAFYGLDFELTADQLIVGAPEAQTFGGPGRVYVYDRVGDDFVLSQTLTTTDSESNFGYFVDVQDQTMAVGAVNLAQPGAVFLYERDGAGLWQPSGKLTPPTRANNDIYGVIGRFADDLLIVGAENGVRQTEPAAGKVYIYQRSGSDYELIQELVAPVSSNGSDVFGGGLTTNGTDLLVKAFGAPAGGFTAFYHFQREASAGPGEPTDPDPSFAVEPGHSGLFFNADRSGEGFMIDMLPDGRGLMFWFTYAEGQPLWLIAQGPVEGNLMRLDQVFAPRGARFGDAFDAGDVDLVEWGSLLFEFDDCDGGRVHYFSDQAGFGDGSIELSRLSNIAGIDCGETRETVVNGFSGGFFNPERGGEGLQIHITDLDGQHTPVVYWPTFDTQGNPLWLFGMGRTEGDSIVIDEMRRYSGAAFGELFDSSDVVGSDWGSVRIDFEGCDQLTIDYQSDDPAYGSGQIDMIRLYQLGLTTCSGTPSAR